MKTLKTVDAIAKAITSIKNRGKKLDLDIHICACSIAEHVNEHHEVSLVNQLIEAMPKGSRVNALKAWFVKFAKVSYCEDTKAFIPLRADALDLTLAFETPWYDFKKEPEFKAFDLEKAVANLLKQALQAQADTDNADKHNIDTVMLSKIQELAN